MADIKQAAKWMEEGRSVRRSSWPSLGAKNNQRPWWMPWRHSHSPEKIIAGRGWDDFTVPSVNPIDLLADDWEIEEKKVEITHSQLYRAFERSFPGFVRDGKLWCRDIAKELGLE